MSVGTWCQLIVIGYFRRDSVGTSCQLIVIGYFRRDNVSTWCQFIFRSDAGLCLMTLMDGSYSWGDKPNAPETGGSETSPMNRCSRDRWA